MKKQEVLLLSERFPYLPGEQFLEDEVKYWGEMHDVAVTIAPIKADGVPRPVPDCIKVDTTLANFHRGFRHYLAGLVSPLVWRELLALTLSRRLSFAAIIEALKTSVRVQHVFAALMAQGMRYDLIYCYWNEAGAYAAVLAKREGKCMTLVSRAHRFDLYEEMRKGGNLPFKRQLIGDFDRVFVISNQAREYLLSTFGNAQIELSRLGVPVDARQSFPSSTGMLRVLSVSFCVPVKRIDRIMDGVVEFARLHPDIRVEWVHIGDGPLRTSLMQRATERVTRSPNLEVSFDGELSNQEVRRRMAEESWDVLINASESEGVPVSIMEAMSFGIPAIASNVGGVSELVEPGTGVLLPADCSALDIASGIDAFRSAAKSFETRAKCKQKIDRDFNASINYLAFARSCSDLLRS